MYVISRTYTEGYEFHIDHSNIQSGWWNMSVQNTVGAGRRSTSGSQATANILERKFERLIDLTSDERRALHDLRATPLHIEPRKLLVRAGEPVHETILVTEGWVTRYKALADGRRQIISFVLPGDFINLYAALFEVSDESFRSITPVTYASIEPDKLLGLFRDHPRLAALLCWSAGENDAILAEHIVRLGRLSAYEKVGHLLLELFIRLEHVGLTDDKSMSFPVTQEAIADNLGLSLVHVNRTLRRLRNDGLIELSDEYLTILDLRALTRAAKFDRGYLENRHLPQTFLEKLFS